MHIANATLFLLVSFSSCKCTNLSKTSKAQTCLSSLRDKRMYRMKHTNSIQTLKNKATAGSFGRKIHPGTRVRPSYVAPTTTTKTTLLVLLLKHFPQRPLLGGSKQALLSTGQYHLINRRQVMFGCCGSTAATRQGERQVAVSIDRDDIGAVRQQERHGGGG